MKTVLVPLDGSALADAALSYVEGLLEREPCEVVVLRVLRPDAVDPERQEAQAHLARVMARLSARGARVSALGREGDPASEILAEIERLAPALVVMSSHGRSGISRWIRGSVAERVLRCSSAPLLILTPEALRPDRERSSRGAVPGHFRRILVGIDGSTDATSPPTVLPVVEALAKLHGADVVLVRVVTPHTLPSLFARDPALRLRPAIERLEGQGIPVRAFGGWGDPASEILDSAEYHDCDLIAVTTEARPGPAAWLHRSVTEKVLRHCRKPLLVMHAPAPAPPARGRALGSV